MNACGGAVFPVAVNMVVGGCDGWLRERPGARGAGDDQTRRNNLREGRVAARGAGPQSRPSD
jgi:hypothetical protein